MSFLKKRKLKIVDEISYLKTENQIQKFENLKKMLPNYQKIKKIIEINNH